MYTDEKQAKFMSLFVKYLKFVGKSNNASAFIKYNNGNVSMVCLDPIKEKFHEFVDRMVVDTGKDDAEFTILYIPCRNSGRLFLNFIIRNNKTYMSWEFTGTGFIPADMNATTSSGSIH